MVSYCNDNIKEETVLGMCGRKRKTYCKVTYTEPFTNTVAKKKLGTEFIPDPNEFFNFIKKTTLVDKNTTMDYIGLMHSHIYAPAILSELDIQYMTYDGVYIIYSILFNKVQAYYKHNDVIKPIKIKQI